MKTRFGKSAQHTMVVTTQKCSAVGDARIMHSLRQLLSCLLEQNSHLFLIILEYAFMVNSFLSNRYLHTKDPTFCPTSFSLCFSFNFLLLKKKKEKKKKSFVGEFFHVFWLHACLGGEFRSGEGCWLLSEVSWDLLVNSFWTRDCGWGRSFASLHLCLYQVQSPVAPSPYPQKFSQCLAFSLASLLFFFRLPVLTPRTKKLRFSIYGM